MIPKPINQVKKPQPNLFLQDMMRNLQQLQAAAGMSQQGSSDPKPVFIKPKMPLINTMSEADLRPPAIGQVHINRLKRFYCDNLDRKNDELKVSLTPAYP